MIQSGAYNSVQVQQPWRLRGTNQQTDDALVWRPPSYRAYGSGPVAAATLRLPGVNLGYWALHNRSGTSSGEGSVHGIGVRIPNYLWRFGTWTNSTTTFVDDTTDAQDAGADDVDLETTTNNDGFVVLSRVPFNAVSLNVGTADTGGSPVRAVRFSTLAGTGWQAAEANLFIHDGAAAAYATGEQLIVFPEPIDWGKSSSLATALPNDYYAMNCRATTAPTTTRATLTTVEVFRLFFPTEAVVDNATLLEEFSGRDLVLAQDNLTGGTGELYGDALVALFGTANGGNRVTCQVRAA